MIIAIDGPAGAGKSTISRRLAERIGCVRLDTGALYRVVALACTRHGLAPDAPGIQRFVAGLAIRFHDDRVFLGAEDVSAVIRTPAISTAASQYAAIPGVRAALLDLQRRIGRTQDSVVDGRDIGTVVFPDAEVKIFLTARAEARAERRCAELRAMGLEAVFETVLGEIRARDKADTERATAPLKRAQDATLVDATTLGIEEVVARCVEIVHAKGLA
jgi:cytidylate kinase